MRAHVEGALDQAAWRQLVGLATKDTISFYGVAPVSQRSGSAQAAAATTVAISTSSVGGGTAWGFSTSTQANAIVTLANELRAALVALGLIAGA